MASPGIFNYTRRLIRAMADQEDPGFRIRLWVSSANSTDIVPTRLPSWISARIVRGHYGTGLPRVWADQVLAMFLPVLDRVDAVHYPKGWMPVTQISRARQIVTMHDTIVHYLAENYPGSRSFLKHRYFVNASLFALQHSDLVLTDSRTSASALGGLPGGNRAMILVTDLGPGIDIPDPLPRPSAKNQVLVIGSMIPYKATAETLRLLDTHAQTRKQRLQVAVTTLAKWPSEWGPEPRSLDIRFTGQLDDSSLALELARSSVLVYLSEIEGFGMPALEAFTCGTPVCYRAGTAVEELLEGVPGGWDGQGYESFARALEAVSHIPPVDITTIRDRLMARYNWTKCARQSMEAYRQVLGVKAETDSNR